MEIIPAIDLIDGRCVRLSQGDYDRKTVYDRSPLEMAKKFETHGIRRLHMVDLDGARAKRVVNQKILAEISTLTKLDVDFGGGIRSEEDVRLAFACGARQVNCGSIAIIKPDVFAQWVDHYGSERIILAADVREGKIAISGWEEKTEVKLLDFLEENIKIGVRYVLCTDIDKDGMLSGPAVELYDRILQKLPEIKLIAGGGVSSVEDLHALTKLQVYGTVVGKAFYEGRISMDELADFV